MSSSSNNKTIDYQTVDNESTDLLMSEHFKKILKPGSVVIDVGANRGQFAEFVIGCQDDIHIYSIEPQKGAFKDLQLFSEKVQEPSIVDAFRYAISKTKGEASFNVSLSDVGSSLLEPLPGQSSKWATPAGTELVPTNRLDSFVQENGISKIDLLKTDAQGFDAEVLRSAGDYLRPDFVSAILIELNFHEFYHGQVSVHELLSDMSECGYQLHAFYPHRNYEGWLWWADGLFLPQTTQ